MAAQDAPALTCDANDDTIDDVHDQLCNVVLQHPDRVQALANAFHMLSPRPEARGVYIWKFSAAVLRRVLEGLQARESQGRLIRSKHLRRLRDVITFKTWVPAARWARMCDELHMDATAHERTFMDAYEPGAQIYLLPEYVCSDGMHMVRLPTIVSYRKLTADEMAANRVRMAALPPARNVVMVTMQRPEAETFAERYRRIAGETLGEAALERVREAERDEPEFDWLSPESQRMAQSIISGEGKRCVTCHRIPSEPAASFPHCTGCNIATYCSRACQRRDWSVHKHACAYIGMMARAMNALADGVDPTHL
jgi:hypothetical protein